MKSSNGTGSRALKTSMVRKASLEPTSTSGNTSSGSASKRSSRRSETFSKLVTA